MLVLTRKEGEQILIGENIRISVVRIAGGGVRLGIEAPGDMPIMRSELKNRLDAENAAAATATDQTNRA